jgi:hypothetical protein
MPSRARRAIALAMLLAVATAAATAPSLAGWDATAASWAGTPHGSTSSVSAGSGRGGTTAPRPGTWRETATAATTTAAAATTGMATSATAPPNREGPGTLGTRKAGTGQRTSEVAFPPPTAGPGVRVAMAPVGLSIEYPLMAQDLGAGPCPPPALVAELRRLGSPPLALSGDSQDLTAPPGAVPSPPPSWETATMYTLPGAFWTQLHCLLSESPDALDVGLNLRKGAPSWAAQMVAGAQSAATNGLEFSLGNEPDLYSFPNYESLASPLPDKAARAAALYLQLAAALHATVGSAPVIGPELAIAKLWRAQLPGVIAGLHEQTVGVHLYPLTACGGPSAVTIGGLLSPAAANAPQTLAWVVDDARRAGLPAMISEANSASCGGQQGVSNSPAAAVWAVRYVLAALKTGFEEVRFHFSNGSYDPFLVRGGSVIARPLESALVALNQWLPVGASIQSVSHVGALVATAIAPAPPVPAPAQAQAPGSAPQASGTGESPHTPPASGGQSAGSGGAAAAARAATAADAAGPRLILDNESAKRRTVVLRASGAVRSELLSATRAGLQAGLLSATHGRIRLTLPGNSVLAVTAAP